MNRLLIFSIILGVVTSVTGCGGQPAANTAPPLVVVAKPTVKPLPQEYRVLAEQLALEIKTSPEQFRDDKGTAEILSEGHSAVVALRGIQSNDADIAYVAAQGQAATSEGIARFERINAMPKPPSESEVLVSSFFAGLLTGDLFGGAVAGGKIGADAEAKYKAVAEELQGLLAAMEKADAVHMMLPKIAEKYAAKHSTVSGRIVVDIDEAWGGFGPNDWLYINNCGPDLEDCTIQVTLIGSQGQVRKNVHFVRHWPANSWIYARYEPGHEVLGREAGRMTVKNIQKADVSIWSPSLTTSIGYVYQGSEKDKDIAERCKKLSFTGRYQPFVKGIVWNTQRGVNFTLDGFPLIPKCRADVSFSGGSQSKAWYWELDHWKQGEQKMFNTTEGQLAFDPDTIDLSLSFPDSSYKHKVTLNVNR